MPVSEGLQTFRPASSFISGDTNASPQSGKFHIQIFGGMAKITLSIKTDISKIPI